MPTSNGSPRHRPRSIVCQRSNHIMSADGRTSENLLARLRARDARIGVIGLGYVGLPLAVEFARAGFPVTGFDVDPAKVADIRRGHSYIPDVAQDDLAKVAQSGRLTATTDRGELAAMDVV